MMSILKLLKCKGDTHADDDVDDDNDYLDVDVV